MKTEKELLEELLEFVGADGWVCPEPDYWSQLWEILPDKKRVGGGWEPPLPLILFGWFETSGIEKMLRLQEQIQYSAEHGALKQIDDYLRALPDRCWYRLPQD